MNRLFAIFILVFIINGQLIPQTWEKIYNPSFGYQYLIQKSKNIFINGKKELFFRTNGLGGAPYIGCYDTNIFCNYKINKLQKREYKPSGNFLKPYKCTDNLNEECLYAPIDYYVYANTDSNFIIRYYLINLSGYCASFSTKRIDISTNNGATFFSPFTGFTSFGGADIYLKDKNFIYLIIDNILKKSTNAGTNWIEVNTLSSSLFVNINPDNQNKLLVSTQNGLYYSSNGGINTANVLSQIIKGLVFKDSNEVFAYSNSAIYKSSDAGANWLLLFNETNWFVNCLDINLSNPLFIYAGTTTGIWRSVNGGVNFSKYNNTLDSNNIYNLLKDPDNGDTLYAVSSKGVYKVWNSLVKISETVIPSPTEFSLSDAFPNPFNNSAIIKFDLNIKSRVLLDIFDISGKNCGILLNSRLNSGSYQVTFDGSDFASGIYFVRLSSDNFINVKKIIMIK